MKADANAAQNIDIYWSTDNVTYTKATCSDNSVSTSYATKTFILGTGANSTSSLYLKVVGYNAVTTGGVLRIDNFTLLGDTYTNLTMDFLDNINLISTNAHGTGLSSGGTYLPIYTNLSININASYGEIANINSSITFNGTLSLISGIFAVGQTSDYTVTFMDADVPLVRTSGSFSLGARTNLVFTDGNRVGAAVIVPNSTFPGATFKSLTINKTNGLTLGIQSWNIREDLNLTLGVFNDNGNIVTVSGNITGNGSHISPTNSGGIIMNGSGGKTLPGLSYGNIGFNDVAGFSFTGSPTINGTLTLGNGNIAVGSNTLTFQNGESPISAVNGRLVMSTTSNLVFGTSGNIGGADFRIPDNIFSSNTPEFNNLTINRTNRLMLNNQNISLRGLLKITAGKLQFPENYIFTLKSTAIKNTAMVDAIGTTGGIIYDAGSAFLVERFIPQGKRSYRYLSPSVNSGTGTIFTNWQEGGDTTSIYGTKITGKIGTPNAVDATTGFDLTNTGTQSLFVFNPATEAYDGYAHTNQSTDTLSAFRGYLMVVRGNRKQDLSKDVATMNADVFLRSKGKLVTGDVTMTTSGTTANGATNTSIKLNSANANGVTLIGNPYAAPINWDNISANATGLEQNYYAWDPTVGTSGAYVTYNVGTGSSNPSGSAVNNFIQPGQSFFVSNLNSTNSTLVIKESFKAASSANLNTVFGGSTPLSKMVISLNKMVSGNYINVDGTVACFSNNFSNGAGVEDATKFSNYPNEDIGINDNNGLLSIDGKKQPIITDTLSLKIQTLSVGANYQLKVDLAAFVSNSLDVYLKDKFLNTRTLLTLSGTNTYNFTTTTNAASSNNRFSIEYQTGILPVIFINTTAHPANGGVNVDWTTLEDGSDFYEVEHSTNGQQFTKLTTVKSKGGLGSSTQNYTWYHNLPVRGINYYRIKSVDISGVVKYSNIVTVTMGDVGVASISIYPNPVTSGKVNIKFNSMVKGDYSIIVSNTLGQKIASNNVQHGGGSSNYHILLPNGITKGNYQVQILGNNYNKMEKLLVQ